MRRVISGALLAVTAVILCTTSVVAQVTTADLVGRVTDNTGAVLPGATITIKNDATGIVRTMPTNETGDYNFTLLPIGAYTVTMELQGFTTQTGHVVLATGDRARLDARLGLSQVNESILVAAEAPLVQTDSATVGALVTEKAVQDLPVNGRNFVRLVQLVPGAFEGLPNGKSSGTAPDDRRQTSAVSINGAPDNMNNQLIDGLDNNERAIGTIGVKPSIDAIAEVKVQTNMYTAEVGRTAGGVVNLITKSGTNSMHGSLFEFARNERFDARNFFATTGPKPDFSQHQFGGSLGGPIARNRTFFFGDVERFTLRQGVTTIATVPTARMRSGDFSELTTPIYDPTTFPRVPFAGNVLTANRLNPIALKYLALYPLPTSPDLANNYVGTQNRTQRTTTTDVRVDHRFNDANNMFIRYSLNKANTYTPAVFPAVDGILGGGGGSFPGPNDTTAHGLGGSLVHIFSPSLIGEVRAGYLNVSIASYPLNYGINASQQFGIANANIDDLTSGLTPVTVAGFAGLGDANFVPLLQINHTKQVSASVTKTQGAHSIKFGGGWIDRVFTVAQSSTPKGSYTFDTLLTNNGAGSGGNSLASLLLGYPSTVARNLALIYPHYRALEPSAYVQDDWHAASWLTMNLGLRYDVFTPFTERDNQMANLNFDTFKLMIAGKDGVSRTAGVKTDYSNLAPRAGFSATLPRRVVVRGGYGLSFFPANNQSQSLMKNPPFIHVLNITSDGASGGIPTARLSDGFPAPTATDPVNLSGALQAVPVDFKSTRAQQYNLFVEREFAGNVIGGGYLGWRATNVVPTSSTNASAIGVTNIDLAPAAPGPIQPRRRYAAQLPNVSSISLLLSDYEANYNAVQTVFQRRQQRGLTLSTSYTFAHGEATAPTPWDTTITERFNGDLVIRHRWVFSSNYELPFGKNSTGVARGLIEGWQLNAIAYWQSGLPFTVTNSTARANTGGTDRPNQIADPVLDHPTIAQWFDTAAFVAQPANTAGNTGRNTLHGPPQRRLDISLFKNLPLSDAMRLQLRVEAFNVTNTPSFANPNAALGAPGFGSITSTGNSIPRQMQFAAKLVF